jgi:hypothetical protein
MDPLHATLEEFAAEGYTHVSCAFLLGRAKTWQRSGAPIFNAERLWQSGVDVGCAMSFTFMDMMKLEAVLLIAARGRPFHIARGAFAPSSLTSLQIATG